MSDLEKLVDELKQEADYIDEINVFSTEPLTYRRIAERLRKLAERYAN